MSEQISRSLTFDPITKVFTEASCMVSEIEVPNVLTTKIIEVYPTKEKSLQRFKSNDIRSIVSFKVKYIPLNNDAGKKLFSEAKKIIDSVLTKDYIPAESVINVFRNGELEETTVINDCIPKTCEIDFSIHNYISIVFEICGIMQPSYL